MANKKVVRKKVAPKKKATSTKKVVKKKKPGAGPPVGNTNAEKWDLKSATVLFNKALKISADKKSDENDFIGEVAQSVGTNLSVMDYLKTKYPTLHSLYDSIKRNCESNCFRNGKRGTIISSLAIMNLKSNHGWTDRTATENTNININSTPLTKEEIDEAKAKINASI